MIKTTIRTLILFSLFSAGSVIAEQLQHRIIGGEDASKGTWPSIVALLHKPEPGRRDVFNRQFCAGNIIADKWVLTAAHCLFDPSTLTVLDPSSYTVARNADDLLDESSVVEMEVKAFEVHPFYDLQEPGSYHDIALIELVEPTTQPAMALFQGDTAEQDGSAAVVIGWGATVYSDTGQLEFPTMLNQAVVPVVSREICNLPQSYDGILEQGQFCAGYPAGGIDSCVGDSGGPLMLSQGGMFQQIGVVSFGDGCAQPEKYGVYADVPFYASWIAQYTEGRLDANNGIGGQQSTGGGKVLHKTQGGAAGFGLTLLLILFYARKTTVRSKTPAAPDQI